jgi:hypothetical protein
MYESVRRHPNYSIAQQEENKYDIKDSNGYSIRQHVPHPYVTVTIDGRMEYLHRLVAEQWLERPEGCDCVDHKNGDRTDNRLSNLEWVSYRDNGVNKTKGKLGAIEFITNKPDDLEPITEYISNRDVWEFENAYYSPSLDKYLEYIPRLDKYKVKRQFQCKKFQQVKFNDKNTKRQKSLYTHRLNSQFNILHSK